MAEQRDSTRRTVPLGLARPALAYLGTIGIGIWTLFAVHDVQQGGEVVPAFGRATAALLGPGALWLALGGVLMVPAVALSIELVHRLGATSRTARSVVGGSAWAAWGLFAAIILGVASRLPLVPEWLAADLVLFAGLGAAFSAVGLNRDPVRVGRVLAVSALAVTLLVIVGSFWMAGRWGAAA